MKTVVRLIVGLAVCFSASLVNAQAWNPLSAFKKQPAASNVGWPSQSTQGVQPVGFIQKWNQGLEKTRQALTLPTLSMPQIKMPQITAPQIQMPQLQMPNNAPQISMPKLQMPKLQMPQIQLPSLDTRGTIFDGMIKPASGGKKIGSMIPKWLKPQTQPQMTQPPTLNSFLSQKRP
jgi:hypothetical protein